MLRSSGLGSGSGQLGHNLTLHPATAGVALMDEVVDMARGVPQSFYVDEFASKGIMFETVAGPPAYAAMSLPLTGRRHAEVMASYPRLAQLGLMVSDSSRGSVHAVGRRAVIRYDLVGGRHREVPRRDGAARAADAGRGRPRGVPAAAAGRRARAAARRATCG